MTTTSTPRTGSTFTLNGRAFHVVAVRAGVVWYRNAAGRGNVEQMPVADFPA